MSETQAAPKLSGQMFLFQKPELMNKEEHGELGFEQPEKRFGFCANVRAIPVTATEIPVAMKNYPIIVVSQDNPVPLAVVGVVDDVNLFVDENGDWDKSSYIPGYVRRYPFGLAGETGGERLAIVIDTAYEGFKKNGGTALFGADGPSDFTQSAIEFCKAFERDRQITDDFAKRLKEFDIIQGQTAQYTPQEGGEAQSFAQYFGVDEKRLSEYPDEKFLELRKAGILPLVYAMALSMGNWRSLMSRRAQRFGLSEDKLFQKAVN